MASELGPRASRLQLGSLAQVSYDLFVRTLLFFKVDLTFNSYKVMIEKTLTCDGLDT